MTSPYRCPQARIARQRYLVFEARPAAVARLYCFPFAGGAAAAYFAWNHIVTRSVELRAAQLPGRHDRIDEPPYIELSPLVSRLADDLTCEGDGRPFAFFGHSVGALLAFELTRELRRRHAPLPALLALSARRAPQLSIHNPALHLLPDEALIQAITKFGGMQPEVRALPDLLNLILPTIRADLTLSETHQYTLEKPLPCPILVFGGQEDPLVAPAELEPWREQSTDSVHITVFPGHHFYLWNVGRKILTSICQLLLMAVR